MALGYREQPEQTPSQLCGRWLGWLSDGTTHPIAATAHPRHTPSYGILGHLALTRIELDTPRRIKQMPNIQCLSPASLPIRRLTLLDMTYTPNPHGIYAGFPTVPHLGG